MTKVMKICLWAIVFTPFIVDKFAFFPYATGESLYTRGLITLISILFLINFLYEKKFRDRVTDKIKLLIRNPLFISILSFVVIFTISTIFAVNKYNAFWGTIERTEGLIGIAYFFSFFVYSLLIFEKKDWLTFFKLNLLIAFIFLSKEIIQFINGVVRPSSFLDNPTFLAGYLLFPIFCSFAVLSEVKHKFWKYFSIIIFILSILGILITGTRGTLVGLIIGFLIVVIYSIIKGKNVQIFKFNLRKLSVVIICLAIIFSAVFIGTRRSEVWQKIPGLGRIALISSEDSTTQTRLITAKTAIESVNPTKNGLKKFLIGWGPDNFSLAYSKYFNPKQFQYEMGWFDRSHNKLLDVYVMNGFLGLLAYLFIYFLFFKSVFKRERFSFLNAGLLFFGVALLGHLLFVFDHITTYISFFAILSFTLYLIIFDNINKEKEKEKHKQIIELDKTKKIFISIFFSVLTIFLIFVYFRNDVLASIQMKKYNVLKQKDNTKAILDNIDSVFEPFTPAQMNIRNDFLLFTENNYNKSDESIVKLLDIALKRAEEYVVKNPFDIRFLVYISSAYSKKGQVLNDIESFNKGEEYFRKMLSYAPNRPDVNYGLALNLFSQKKYSDSFNSFEQAFDISHNYFKKEGKVVTDIYTVFFKYFYDLKDKDSFIKTAIRLKENNYITEDILNQIINSLEKENKWPRINFTS